MTRNEVLYGVNSRSNAGDTVESRLAWYQQRMGILALMQGPSARFAEQMTAERIEALSNREAFTASASE